MLPDEPVYPQFYPATFTDEFGTEETVIRSDGPVQEHAPCFFMTLRGVTFSSYTLEHWLLQGDYAERELQRFDIRQQELRLFRLHTMIPVPVVDVGGVSHSAALYLGFEDLAERNGGTCTRALLDFQGRCYACAGAVPVFSNWRLNVIETELPVGTALKICCLCSHDGLEHGFSVFSRCLRPVHLAHPDWTYEDLYEGGFSLTEAAFALSEANHFLHWCRHFTPRKPDPSSRN